MPDLTIPASRVDAVVAALDANDAAAGILPTDGLVLRIGKVAEEYGEAWAALIGMFGQNPRKGRTHTEVDFVGELFDVALAAVVAAASLPGSRRRFRAPAAVARPVELWSGMRHLGRRIGCTLHEESDDPVRTFHDVANAALRLAGAAVGPGVLADQFAAHVWAKTFRVVEAVDRV